MPNKTPNRSSEQPGSDDVRVYDAFISYSSEDATWVRESLVERLEAQGLRVCLDDRDFHPGVPIMKERERAVLTSRYTLVVLTPAFVESPWNEFDEVLTFTLAHGFTQRRLIPLVKAACTPPSRIAALVSIDFTDPLTQEFAYVRLLTAINPAFADQQMEQIPLDTVPAHVALPPLSRMPLAANPLFIGRDDELRELALVLKTGDTAAIGQIAAATGLGGIGKTQLAVEFVHRYGQFFKGGVFWLSFANPASVPAEVAACGGLEGMRLSPDFDQLPLEQQIPIVRAAWESRLPRLLVFDNCEDEELLDQWRPKYGACRVLLTSRRSHWSAALGVQTLALDVLLRSESIALLRTLAPTLEETAAYAIAVALGDLPLALHLAGSFLSQYHRVVSPHQYLQRLQTPTLLDDRSLQVAGLSPTHHVQHIARTFEQSYTQLDSADAGDAVALALLARIAHFAAGEAIPYDLAMQTLDLKDEPDTRLQAEDALIRLNNLGLVELEVDGSLRVHRLVIVFVQRVSTDTTAQPAVEQTMARIAHDLNTQGYPASLLRLQPHFRAITNAALLRQDEAAGILAMGLGDHLEMIGEYAEAQGYYERALVIYQQMLGAEHPDTAASLNNMGRVLQAQGQYREAQDYYEQALAICQQMLGAEHPNTAASLNNMGRVLRAQGQYREAQDYYEQTLAIYQRVLGAEHLNTAVSLNNMGFVLQAQGQYREAQDYYEQALAIHQRVLGAEHPNTAMPLGNLGSVLQAQEQYREAQDYFEQMLAIYQRVLGAEHVTYRPILHTDRHPYGLFRSFRERRAAPGFGILPATIRTHQREIPFPPWFLFRCRPCRCSVVYIWRSWT